MNTNYLMISSAATMGITGLAGTFFPQEILNSFILPSNSAFVLVIQIAGALYLGFALMNWMSKSVLIGGIYAKPLAIGNFFHFMVGAFALIKVIIKNTYNSYILIAVIFYSIFAILFGLLIFTAPVKKVI